MKCFWERCTSYLSPVKPSSKQTAATLSVFLLWGCSASDPWLAGASLVSLVYTDKTIVDHVVGWTVARDCSLVRFSKGEAYCLPGDHEKGAKRQRLYCYRDLGGVSCYQEPLKNATSQTTVYLSNSPKGEEAVQRVAQGGKIF